MRSLYEQSKSMMFSMRMRERERWYERTKVEKNEGNVGSSLVCWLKNCAINTVHNISRVILEYDTLILRRITIRVDCKTLSDTSYSSLLNSEDKTYISFYSPFVQILLISCYPSSNRSVYFCFVFFVGLCVSFIFFSWLPELACVCLCVWICACIGTFVLFEGSVCFWLLSQPC